MCHSGLPYISRHACTVYEGRSGSGMPRVGVCDVLHCSSNCNPSVCIDINCTEPVDFWKALLFRTHIHKLVRYGLFSYLSNPGRGMEPEPEPSNPFFPLNSFSTSPTFPVRAASSSSCSFPIPDTSLIHENKNNPNWTARFVFRISAACYRQTDASPRAKAASPYRSSMMEWCTGYLL